MKTESLRCSMRNGYTKKIKYDEGFSIIETLTALVIFGIIAALTAMTIKGLFFSPGNLIKSEALVMASGEIDQSINKGGANDTNYINYKGNLVVTRETIREDSLYSITVRVCSKQNNREILRLHAYRRIDE